MTQFVNLQITLLCCTDLCQEKIKEEAGECSEETAVCVSCMVFVSMWIQLLFLFLAFGECLYWNTDSQGGLYFYVATTPRNPAGSYQNTSAQCRLLHTCFCLDSIFLIGDKPMGDWDFSFSCLLLHDPCLEQSLATVTTQHMMKDKLNQQ